MLISSEMAQMWIAGARGREAGLWITVHLEVKFPRNWELRASRCVGANVIVAGH